MPLGQDLPLGISTIFPEHKPSLVQTSFGSIRATSRSIISFAYCSTNAAHSPWIVSGKKLQTFSSAASISVCNKYKELVK